jgi:hypothetical protein
MEFTSSFDDKPTERWNKLPAPIQSGGAITLLQGATVALVPLSQQ